MIVCICNAVSEKQIRQAVQDGAGSIADLRVATGCGTTCGQCTEQAVEIINQADGSNERPGINGLFLNPGF